MNLDIRIVNLVLLVHPLGVLCTVLMEVLLFFLSSPHSESRALSPVLSSRSSVVLGASVLLVS